MRRGEKGRRVEWKRHVKDREGRENIEGEGREGKSEKRYGKVGL